MKHYSILGIILVAALFLAVAWLLGLYRIAGQGAQDALISGTIYKVGLIASELNGSKASRNPSRQGPYTDLHLVIRQGTKNIEPNPVVMQFVTDIRGRFQLELPAGQYCIVESARAETPYDLTDDFVAIENERNQLIDQQASKEKIAELDYREKVGRDSWQQCRWLLAVSDGQVLSGLELEVDQTRNPIIFAN
jgi:hypothetical protein